MNNILNSNQLEKNIQSRLQKLLPKHDAFNGYEWAMFPAGKLFRPMLATSIANDLKANLTALDMENIINLACALETHHSYSLVHDDLPSMDNDDIRRGKAATHKKFGEWQAILIGDGLLNISYQFLIKVKNLDLPNYQLLLKIFAHSLGPKGLIHGQYLDLSQEMTLNFENTILTHKLKTGRLIQVAMLSPAIILNSKEKNINKTLWRAGENIGILFQLLDDLSELSEEKLSPHELEVNPWLKFQNQTLKETLNRLDKLIQNLELLKLKNTNRMLADYFLKMNNTFKDNQITIAHHLSNKIDLNPIVLLLDRLSKL